MPGWIRESCAPIMNKGKLHAGLCKEGCGQQTGRSNFPPLPSDGEVITGWPSSVWGLLFKGGVEKMEKVQGRATRYWDLNPRTCKEGLSKLSLSNPMRRNEGWSYNSVYGLEAALLRQWNLTLQGFQHLAIQTHSWPDLVLMIGLREQKVIQKTCRATRNISMALWFSHKLVFGAEIPCSHKHMW